MDSRSASFLCDLSDLLLSSRSCDKSMNSVSIAGHVRVLFVDLVGSCDVFSTPRALVLIAGHVRVLFVDLVGSCDVFSTPRALVFIAGHVCVLYVDLVGIM